MTRAAYRDRLFAGLQGELEVFEWHRLRLAAPPLGFEILATNPNCPVQAIRHNQRPLYGVQFHPELAADDGEPGRVILTNFLALAGP